MQLILTVKSDYPPRRMLLKPGQVVQVGRTAWADVNFPRDAEMAEIHFALECRPRDCLLRTLQEQTPTLLNGEPVTESEVDDGDEITAGGTVFGVTIEGKPLPPAAPESRGAKQADEPANDSGFPHVGPVSVAEVAADCELGGAAIELAEGRNAREFLERLIEAGLLKEAIAFLGACLPPREAVWWATLCCKTGDEADSAAREAARAWAADPSEENRRAAQSAANATQMKTPAGCAAQAAFMGGGSINEAGQPDVAPPPQLSKRLIGGAIKLAALQDREDLNAAYERFLKLGVAVADGEQRWG